jgi:CRISPR/Cas system CSM-associated protein Csm3 (group 7 of RAMP superfamily)
MFGNTSIASRVRIEDAYPVDKSQLKLEERNGVAIDRVFGSVAVGPFNYQVCTGGEFETKIHLKNFSLAQLGLIGLVLRDLNEGWFGLGFAKSRGLGMVEVKLNSAVVQYPGCILEGDRIHSIGSQNQWSHNSLLGAGVFLEEKERQNYGFPANDIQATPIRAESMSLGFGVQLSWQGNDEAGVPDLFVKSVRAWRQKLEETAP